MFAALAVVLITLHIRTIVEVRDVSVPIVGKLPMLEQRLQALKAQMELTELHAVSQVGSSEEQIEMYALPKEPNISRLIATFEVIRDVLKRDNLLSAMSDITISDPEEGPEGSKIRRVSVEFAVHEDGLRTIPLIVRLAGLMTVGDVLTEEEINLLVDRIEEENPAGIVSLEQFLSADLLGYAEDPKTYEEQIKRSFSGDGFLNAFENVLRTSLLYDVKRFLQSDLGTVLRGYKLWPMQIMALQEVSIHPGNAPRWHKLGITALLFSEEK